MYDLTVIKRNGGAYIDSREVAAVIGKKHGHLMRDIAGYVKIMQKMNQSKIGVVDFFVKSAYLDAKGETRSCYLLSKMGCELVANKLTGARGVMFTVVYVATFNAIEAAEREAEIKAHHRPRLSELNSSVKNILNGMSQSCVAPENVMKFLCGVYEPLGIEVIPFYEDDYYGYFTVTEIAAQLGIYSETGRPHGHAISAIISKLKNHASHAVAVPYGVVGITIRYNSHIVECVRNWLVNNDFPRVVPYLDFYYHIYYAY